MVSIRWCLQQKDGLQLIEPNSNMSNSYIRMAEESISVLQDIVQSRMWTAVTAYYVFYYSLYSLMMRLGVKCEIHSCTLEFMKEHLRNFYDSEDVDLIRKAFQARIDLQYYADRPIDAEVIEQVRKYCKVFFIKTKDILAKISEEQTRQIREALRKVVAAEHQRQINTRVTGEKV